MHVNGPARIRYQMYVYCPISKGSVTRSATMEKASAVCRRLRLLFLQKPTPRTASNTAAKAATSKTRRKNENPVRIFKEMSNLRWQRPEDKASIRRLTRDGRFSRINEIVQHQKQYPDIKDEGFTARLITIYGKAKMLDHALKLFDEMPDLNCPRTAVSFNALLAACIPSQNFDKLMELFRELPAKTSIDPDVISYALAVKALCKKESFDDAVSLVEEMAARGVDPDAATFYVLLRHLYYSGRFSEGEKVWDLMKEKKVDRDLRCYNSRLQGMIRQNRFSQGVGLVKEMVREGLSPNSCTFSMLIEGLFEGGDVESEADINLAFKLCKNAVDLGIKLSPKIVRKVSDELVNNSKVEEAKELLHLFHLPSSHL